MSVTKANLTVNSVNWNQSTNVLNVQGDISGATFTLTGITVTCQQTGSASKSVTQAVNYATTGASVSFSKDISTSNLITLFSNVDGSDKINQPLVYVTGFTYTTSSISNGVVTNSEYWIAESQTVGNFLLAPDVYLTYNSGSSATLNYLSYNYTSNSITIDASGGSVVYGKTVTPSNTVSQSINLVPTSSSSWLPGITYKGTLKYSTVSTFTLIGDVLATTPLQLPPWNPIQYNIYDASFNIRTYFPAQFFDICGNSGDNRYNSPYFGYDSSANVITTINYTDITGVANSATNTTNIQTTSVGLNCVPQYVNGLDASASSMYWSPIYDLSLSSVQTIDTISYQVQNSVGITDSSNAIPSLPFSYTFNTNDISLNVPSSTNITNNNTIRLDISNNSAIAIGDSSGNIKQIMTSLLDPSGNGIENKYVNYFNTSAGQGFQPVIFNNATSTGTYNIQVGAIDALGEYGIATTIPVSYLPTTVDTNITAVKCKYSSTTGLFSSLDLSLNKTSSNANVTTVPMNQNNYFGTVLDVSLSNITPASNTAISIPSAKLQTNTLYLPAVANNVSDTVNMAFTNGSGLPVDLYTAVNYTDLSANGGSTLPYSKVYVYNTLFSTANVSSPWTGTATNYNLLDMSNAALTLSNRVITTRMFVNPQPMSWVVMVNSSSSPNYFYIYSFLRPNFDINIFNNFTPYYQTQLLNSYTMYDYLNISGLIGEDTTAIPDGTAQNYTTSYSSNTLCSSFSEQQVLFADNTSTVVNTTGFSTNMTTEDYQILSNYDLTVDVEMIQSLSVAKDISSNNVMGFNQVSVTVNNPNFASFDIAGVTLLLVRSNNTLGSNNSVLVWNNEYLPSSLTSKTTNETSKQYLINVGANISNVLQGTYQMYAIVSLKNVNNGLGITYNINLLSNAANMDVSYRYPKIIQTAYSNTTGVLSTMINNNYLSTTNIAIDGVDIQTLAENVFQSRVVATQLNIPNTGTKNVFAELSTSEPTAISNYFTITATNSGTTTNTVVTEYTPSRTFVNL